MGEVSKIKFKKKFVLANETNSLRFLVRVAAYICC